nr:MAG TPA: hypothetical protein [Caudoviricetes sp.]
MIASIAFYKYGLYKLSRSHKIFDRRDLRIA